jgi:hypothetical protein
VLNEDLLREAKKLATESNRTLTSVIEDALRETLARRKIGEATQPVRLPTFRGSGLQPGVDLDSAASLLDLMETTDAHA